MKKKQINVKSSLTLDSDYIDALFKYIPDNIYFKDRESHFIRINQSQAKFLELKSPEEAIGKTDFDFFEREPAEKAFEDEQNILKTKKAMILKEEKITTKYGAVIWFSVTKVPLYSSDGSIIGTFGLSRNITKNKLLEMERESLIKELTDSLNQIKTLKGLIPICANCKKIRDDDGYWYEVEKYLQDHSDSQFTHGLCQECIEKLYPDYAKSRRNSSKKQ